jgi:nitrous oxidase accessory protein
VKISASVVVAIYFAPLAAIGAEKLQPRIEAAAPGATITLPAGEYEGPLVITKPLTLRSGGDATIRGDGKSHVIHIKAPDVTIEGLRVRKSGIELGKDHAGIFVEGDRAVIRHNVIEDSLHGIYLKKANDCRLIGNRIRGKTALDSGAAALKPDEIRPGGSDLCDTSLNQNQRGNGIHLWNSQHATIEGNDIRDTRDGIYFTFSNHALVRRNTVARTRIGLHYMYSDYNTFDENRFTENAVGAAIMISKNLLVRRNEFSDNVGNRAYGMVLVEVDGTRFEENTVAGNSVGVFLQISNANIFAGNRVTGGYIGVRIDGSSDTNTFAQNRFAGNMHPVEIDGSLGTNRWADACGGNRWGASSEVDLNGDGVGDLPHRETDCLGGLRRPFPLAGLLSGSPALGLIRFAQQHAALPNFPAITDPAPLTAAWRGGGEPQTSRALASANDPSTRHP